MSPTQRLLYRGALSLPDSDLLLDGLTFFAPVVGTGISLLQNQLALALESMRRRPCLSFVRVEKLRDLSLDTSGEIQMDIHPDAALSNVYFQNTFCLLPCESIFKEGRSEVGIRVSLGDVTTVSFASSANPGTTEMVIYARPATPLFQATQTPITLQLCVARITPNIPPPSGCRLPRPDDPTPRQPPLAFAKRARLKAQEARMAHLDKAKGKRTKPTDTTSKGKTTNVAKLGSGVRLGHDSVFKVPTVPASRKVATIEESSGTQFDEIEKTNKMLIKKIAVGQLASREISRTHPEFTELYGHVYRGAAFALRKVAKACHLDSCRVAHVVDAHIQLYLHDSTSPDGSLMVP